ncbi:MAG: SMC-Scp complex subunit ScpB [Pelagibacteraceae bacterium]|nr:SMC-Scp complex subunit ScpB [Pelagibacteraceae bacterium]MBG76669.1 SMC-Scp complex subunit ScpB [Pelagibacteraceae bacterium]
MINSKDHRLIEALIFGSTEPVSEKDILEKISDKSLLNKILNDLQNFYKERGVNLIKTGNMWSFRTSDDLSNELTIFKTQKRKLSKAAIEVLSIIAYHQPITRAEIENIRGVQMGRGTIDILIEIGWIKPKGRKNTPGRPLLWATTDQFLEHFSLEDIKHLPGIDELKESGFLDKRSAISTITDIVEKNDDPNDETLINENDNNLDDFINQKIE